jgi:hypothetical protein
MDIVYQRTINMGFLKILFDLFKCGCPTKNNSKSDMDDRIDRMREHIINRATVNGEDDWMLRIRKHDKGCHS